MVKCMKQSRAELELMYKMNYDELCNYLVKKYGEVPGAYFVKESCKSKNRKIVRTNEGLFIHHIKECESIELGNTNFAQRAPFEYQEGKNLVYCNYFEHMFLHIRIVKEFLNGNKVKQTRMIVGLGGLLNFIFPEIIDYINGYEYQKEYMRTALSVIDGNEDFFAQVISEFNKELKNIMLKDSYLSYAISQAGLNRDIFIGKMTSAGAFNRLIK